jgi:dynactin complex subunit
MKKIPYKELELQITDACTASISKILDKYPEDQFYAFALYTNDAMHTLSIVANSKEMLRNTVKKYNETIDPKYGITSTSKGMHWSFGDWGAFSDESDFSRVNETLFEISNFLESQEGKESEQILDRCHEKLWSTALKSFTKINSISPFNKQKFRECITLLIVGDLPEDRVLNWLNSLNPPQIVEQYLNRDLDA